MARRPVIAANWKMNKTHLEAQLFVEGLRNRLQPQDYDRVEIVICPPFTALRTVQTLIDADDLDLSLGAQDVHWEPSGAYTGEISVEMLVKLHVTHAIVGHSERREYFGETDESVNRKVKAVAAAGMTPIMCVGESREEREGGLTEEKVAGQVRAGLEGLTPEQVSSMVIAYEPIWAIGTGLTASPKDAQETISLIRSVVEGLVGEAADPLRIQYGGSVNGGNIAALMAEEDIDGALVGGASLDPDEFSLVVRYEP